MEAEQDRRPAREMTAEEIAEGIEMLLFQQSGFGRDLSVLDGHDVCFARPGWWRVTARDEVPVAVLEAWDREVDMFNRHGWYELVGFTDGAALRVFSMGTMHTLADLPPLE